ncbi:peptidase domain-containing ABC transporter [Leptolyngbya sp. GGD]|uniref:peptidase domain-containing ABC transporter n=1 Tax=Leptolyngbya sp. GGD TaxID=2997907 RepID=UPI00227D34C0|nr:peptidase domain-containing ABC transporter [Leptolyngbya sp. GGD]MCY6494434.1 peptidase domain-containing ABC transporter [Leptolyngbya sp. GGD]
MKRYHCIRQQGEADCGAACLTTIAKHYGSKVNLKQVRDWVGTGQSGANLWGLQQGSEKLGFNARPVKAAPNVLDRILEAPLPAILHWQGTHWVVLYGKKGRDFVVADPGVGIRYLSAIELAEGWNDWVMLLLEPDPTRFGKEEQGQPDRNSKSQRYNYFWSRLSAYRGILTQAFLINVVVGFLSLASPILMQLLTDDVLVRGDLKLLNTIAIAVIAILVVNNLLELVQSNLITHFAQRLELGLVLDFCKQILRLPLSYYESRRSGEVLSRLQDIQQLNYLVSQTIVSLPSRFFVALISLGLMLFYSWKLSVFAIAVVLLMTVSVVIFQPSLQRKLQQSLAVEAENQGVLVETFKGALTVKTLVATPQFWGEFQNRFSRLTTLNLRTNQIGIFNNSFSGLVASAGGIGLLWFGGQLVISPAEQLSIGQLFAFKAMNDNLTLLITTVIGFVDELTRVKAATERLSEVTQATPEDANHPDRPSATISPDAAISLNNVSFDYADGTPILENFSVQIPGGQVTALIGQSGCGKSTLVKLLAGLYPLSTGNIRIGNYNQADLSLSSLRQQVVLVVQDAHFWNRSIIDNFRLAAPDATFDEIVESCRLTGADDFISKLPNKYQTILGEFAANLSGGQRQRLAISRAIVQDPPVLILDESTSGLDPASEAALMDQLLQQRQGKTTLFISHRPSVIRRADWIVLLDQGQLKLQGSRAEILAKANNQLEHLYTSEAQVA